ncbi:MAG TPA: class I SAM-dependent methyltransferase [Thermodesulfobacteriota bacterium]|nr:class I SAM-dependent methyltransferase [Thermodesulfobacteriota bacterium]
MSRTLTRIARSLLPPLAVDLVRGLVRRLSSVRAPEWEYVPSGWRTNDPRIKGWNVQNVLDTQRAKWPHFLESVRGTGPLGLSHEALKSYEHDYAVHNTYMTYAYVLALAARKKDRISLLDWGGGIGHYYVISRVLLADVEIEYHCKDLRILCQGGRELLPEANFHESEEECFGRTYDLVLASSSLHYSEDWRQIVRRLASATHSYLYITRLPIVHQAPSFVVVQRPYQHGYETEYLGWFLNRQEFLAHLNTLQMELLREFLIQERPYVFKAPEQGEYRGFLFRQRQEG